MHFLYLKRWKAAYEPRPDAMNWPGPFLSATFTLPTLPMAWGSWADSCPLRTKPRQVPPQDMALLMASRQDGPVS